MINFAILNKICIKCGSDMVKTTGGYKCLICGNEYTDKQIKAENDKLKEKVDVIAMANLKKNDTLMIDKLRNKLGNEGRSFRWFINNYLKSRNYQTIMAQVNGFTSIQDYTKAGIMEYLRDK